MSKSIIIDAALRLALVHGYKGVTRSMVARKLGVATGTINYHVRTMARLRSAILRGAIEKRIARVFAEGVIDKHPVAMKADPALRATMLLALV